MRPGHGEVARSVVPRLRGEEPQFEIDSVAHLGGLISLMRRIRARRPDVVHFQWIVLPPLDVLAMWLIRRWCPVVLTVHDSVPYNGSPRAFVQRLSAVAIMHRFDRLIVHTKVAQQRLAEYGLTSDKICRRGIGRTFQIVRPFPGLTVEDNVVIGALNFYEFGRLD